MPKMVIVWQLLVLISFISPTTGIFVYRDNPYNGTRLNSRWFMVNVLIDKSPLHSSVFYPIVPGDYAVYFFVPGANGFVEGEIYTDYLSLVASRGFVVISSDLVWPALSNPRGLPKSSDTADLSKTQSEKYLEQYQWMKSNLQNLINKRSKGINIVWNATSLGSHSSGADVTLRMLQTNFTLFNSSVFLEPFSFNLHGTVPFTIPSLMYGTELMQQHFPLFPPCSVKGVDFQHFYDNWRPLKILLQVKNWGHCDILDDVGWEACHLTKVCMTKDHPNLEEYKIYISGLTSAFLVSTALGRNATLEYILDRTRVPATYMKLEYQLK